jgi:hypothetical protein
MFGRVKTRGCPAVSEVMSEVISEVISEVVETPSAVAGVSVVPPGWSFCGPPPPQAVSVSSSAAGSKRRDLRKSNVGISVSFLRRIGPDEEGIGKIYTLSVAL